MAFINSKIEAATKVAREIEEKLSEYSELVNDDNNSEKTKSTIEAAYNKKQKELNTVNDIIRAYKEDLRALIKEAYDLENKDNNCIEINCDTTINTKITTQIQAFSAIASRGDKDNDTFINVALATASDLLTALYIPINNGNWMNVVSNEVNGLMSYFAYNCCISIAIRC